MTQVFETTDPDVASEIFREAYSTMRMQVHGPRPLFSVASTPVGAARLDRTIFRMGLEGAADPFSDIYILGVRSGSWSTPSTVRKRPTGRERCASPSRSGCPG